MAEYGNDNLNNTLASLIKAVNTNTNTIEEYLTEVQENAQIQGSTDRTNLKDIGNNRVNVINYIDPDTLSGAVANNESNLNNTANAEGNAISLALTLAIKNIINQLGLVNITDNNNS